MKDIDVTARASLSDSFQGLTNISVRLLVSVKVNQRPLTSISELNLRDSSDRRYDY